MTKAIVLLSGGQDSTTALYWAKSKFDEVSAISVLYGQRHRAETDAATEIAIDAGASHRIVVVPALQELGGSALVDRGLPIQPIGGLADAEAPHGLPTSFVPGRNALFLTIAAAYAVHELANDIVIGVCQTDYSGYPDCRREFIQAMQHAMNLAMPSSCRPLTIHTPLMDLSKADTVRLARSLPGCWQALALSITCYEGRRPGCGTCPACELRAKGFNEAEEVDPAEAAPVEVAND